MKQPELGNKVLDLRQKMGLTQAELAERCSVSKRTIQRIEACEVTPRDYTIREIFACLGYEPEYLSEDMPNPQPAIHRRSNLTRRLVKYVKELFNLKTNTMKKLSVLSLFAILLVAGIFATGSTLCAQNRKLQPVTNSLLGVWQQVIFNPQTGEVETYLPFLKIFYPDGTYVHMTSLTKLPGYLNASGKWKVTASNKFLEYVELMHGQQLRNHTEEQTFSIENINGNVMMNSHFHTQGVEMGEIHETWRKCGFTSRETITKMLNEAMNQADVTFN